MLGSLPRSPRSCLRRGIPLALGALGLMLGLSDAAFGIALFCAIAFPCVLLWAMFGVVMLRLLTTPRARRVFNLTVCAMLLATAVMIMLA